MGRTFVASTLTLALAATTAAVLAAPPASANHQPGVTYVGQTLSGNMGSPPLAGPRVEVDVAADGSSITRFELFNAPFAPYQGNGACQGTTYNYKWTGVLPITNPPGYWPEYHFFSNLWDGSGGPIGFDGSFEPGTVSGRFSYKEPGFPDVGCSTMGNMGWVASAPGGCLGSPEFVGTQAKIAALTVTMKALKVKMKKARKGAERANLQGRWLAEKRLWKKYFKLKKKYKKVYLERRALFEKKVC